MIRKHIINLAIASALILPSSYVLAVDNQTNSNGTANSDSTQQNSMDTTTSPNSTNTTTPTNSTDTTTQMTTDTASSSMPVDDKTLDQNIKGKIAKNKLLQKQNVMIVTQNGVVMLTGNLNSQKQALLFIVLTGSTRGVSDVDTTKLTLNSKELDEDFVLRAKIKAALMRDDIRDVSVTAEEGDVTLMGTVKTQEMADHAESVARAVKGVNNVKSEIKVNHKKLW